MRRAGERIGPWVLAITVAIGVLATSGCGGFLDRIDYFKKTACVDDDDCVRGAKCVDERCDSVIDNDQPDISSMTSSENGQDTQAETATDTTDESATAPSTDGENTSEATPDSHLPSCTSDYCENDGNCWEDPNDLVDPRRCACGPGTEGARCELDKDHCLDGLNPCFAGVFCQDQPAPWTGATCGDCPLPYYGDGRECFRTCEHAPPCGDGLTCVDTFEYGSGHICVELAVQVVTGDKHSCALLQSGRVQCWGSNLKGQTGAWPALRIDEPWEHGKNLPYVDLADHPAVMLAAGAEHTCALLDDGKVKCWGANEYGQLGLGDAEPRGDDDGEMGEALPFVELGDEQHATAIAAGGHHSCAILDDEQVKCWGRNSFGQLGLGSVDNKGNSPGEMGDALSVVDVGADRTPSSLALGYDFSCAVFDDGGAKCWGNNATAQLGLGHLEAKGSVAGDMGDELPQIDVGDRSVTALAAGRWHVCALVDEGRVICWGRNDQNQAGHDGAITSESLGDAHIGSHSDEMGMALKEVKLPDGRYAVSVSAGQQHSCAVLDDDTHYCWGEVSFIDEEIGRGGQIFFNGVFGEPEHFGGALSDVIVSTARTCFLFESGLVRCFGSNTHGQVGQSHEGWYYKEGTFGTHPVAPIALGQAAPGMSAAQLLGSSFPDSSTTSWTDGPGRISTAVFGEELLCVVTDDMVGCWGNNDANCQVEPTVCENDAYWNELPPKNDAYPSIEMGAGIFIDSIAITNWRGYAVTKGGEIRAWGGGPENYDWWSEPFDPFPKPVFSKPVQKIVAGDDHACVLLDDGDVICWADLSWGGNNNWQLGKSEHLYLELLTSGEAQWHGTPEPLNLGGGLSAVDIWAKGNRACALLEDNRLKCWGRNTEGRLGLGNKDIFGLDIKMGNTLDAVDVGADRHAVDVALGDAHTCALLDNGDVKCWGTAADGKPSPLGYGDDEIRGDEPGEMGDDLPAVDLGLDRTAMAIAAGSGHTCALLDDESIKCWGSNDVGQLGMGHVEAIGDYPDEMGDNLVAVDLPPNLHPIGLVAGDGATCALLDDGNMTCWGSNTYGRLGFRQHGSIRWGDEPYELQGRAFIADMPDLQ